MVAKKLDPKTAELVPLQGEKGRRPRHILLVRYRPGFKAAYGLVTQDDGNSGPLSLSTFGDSFNAKCLRAAWRTWERHSDDPGPSEWTPRSAVARFVRWLNSGGEARVRRARAARRGRA